MTISERAIVSDKKRSRTIYLTGADDALLVEMYKSRFNNTNDRTSISALIAEGIRLAWKKHKTSPGKNDVEAFKS